MQNKYYVFIGIEIHCELNTKTKMFSCAPVGANSNEKPNTFINSVDLGYPGALPTVNKQAVILAILAGKLFNMDINKVLRFDRKNYFYPDLPKGYQITQYYEPLCTNGKINDVTIEKLFLEEDTAKLKHLENASLLDYNRCGLPLIEIVSDHSMHSAQDALNYISKITYFLKNAEITKGNWHEGNIRCDLNISLSKNINIPGVKVEIKNLNKESNIFTAINYEIQRQEKLLDINDKMTSETRRFDEKTQTTILMRKKHTINDYKYFSEPSILPIYLTNILNDKDLTSYWNERINKVKTNYFLENYDFWTEIIFKQDVQLKNYESDFIFIVRNIINKYFAFFICKNFINIENYSCLPQSSREKHLINLGLDLNLVLSIVEKFKNIWKTFFINNPKEALNITEAKSEFIKFVQDLKINFNDLEGIWKTFDKKIESLIVKPDNQINLDSLISTIINDNPNLKDEFAPRPERVIKFIMGQIMKETKGKANPKQVLELIHKILN